MPTTQYYRTGVTYYWYDWLRQGDVVYALKLSGWHFSFFQVSLPHNLGKMKEYAILKTQTSLVSLEEGWATNVLIMK